MNHREYDTFGAVCVPDESGHCITCSDEGLPARVVTVMPERALATVDADGRQLEVATDVLENVRVGDVVLVHAGLAIARLDREL